MPVTKTTTVTTRSTTAGVAVHTISFRGLAGGIFTLLAIAAILYVIGFATVAWTLNYGYNRQNVGLWETCTCRGSLSADWFRAVQAMITIGLVLLLLAMIICCVYMCIHTISKNSTIMALVIVCFLAVLFMLIGFIIYGVKMESVSWSYVVCVIAGILTLVAGILGIVQMKQSGL